MRSLSITHRRTVAKWLACLLIVPLIGGVAIAGFTTPTSLKAIEARQWPQTKGSVSSIELHEGALIGGGRARIVRVGYLYQVNDRSFRSTRINYGSPFNVAARVQLVRRYEVGDSIPVYYNPKRPEEAVLLRPAGILNFFKPVAGVFVSLLSALFIKLLLNTGVSVTPRRGNASPAKER